MADFLHGPKIKENGQKRKTHLHAIIDDATRYVVHAGFFTSEGIDVMMTGLMATIRTCGKPLRLYTDNGACYAGKHLKFVCANLGRDLVHTPTCQPRGRGKVERVFWMVRDQFLDGRKKALARGTYGARRIAEEIQASGSPWALQSSLIDENGECCRQAKKI